MDGLPGHYLESAIPSASRTIRTPIDCRGAGLHSGRETRLVLKPAPAGTGILFRRTDLGIDLPARHDLVTDTRLCTKLSAPGHPEATVGTIEHIMAALAATSIDNIVIELDGPEIPIFDGSAEPFVFLIDCAGLADLPARRTIIEILSPIAVSENGATARFEPLPAGGSWLGLDLAVSIDFAARAIGQQRLEMRLTEESFRATLARARTFAQAQEIAQLQAAGLARGGSLANAVVVEGDRILNPEGLREPQEFVRHKMLDAVGDLYLGGAAIIGRFVGDRSGHRTNNLLLRALFANPGAYRHVTAGHLMTRGYGAGLSVSPGIAAAAA